MGASRGKGAYGLPQDKVILENLVQALKDVESEARERDRYTLYLLC